MNIDKKKIQNIKLRNRMKIVSDLQFNWFLSFHVMASVRVQFLKGIHIMFLISNQLLKKKQNRNLKKKKKRYKIRQKL